MTGMALARLSLAKGLRPAKIAYYAQRLLVGPRSRRFAADAVAAVVRLRWGAGLSAKEVSGEEEEWLRALRAVGYARLGALLDPAQVTDIHAFLAARPLADHDDPARTFLLDAVPPGVAKGRPHETIRTGKLEGDLMRLHGLQARCYRDHR
jgi:hypothetical protein